MIHLIYLFVTGALLAGFLALTQYETLHGVRFFSDRRERLDKGVARITFIIEHVDFLAFIRDEVHHAMTRVGHAIAHLTLQVVRAVERFLTRVVRYLRTRHAEEVAPRETAREFVKTLSDFKGGLNATHPEISDIE